MPDASDRIQVKQESHEAASRRLGPVAQAVEQERLLHRRIADIERLEIAMSVLMPLNHSKTYKLVKDIQKIISELESQTI